MKPKRHVMRRHAAQWLFTMCLMCVASADAIEGPKTPPPVPPPPAEKPAINVTPSDESVFELTLERVAHRRNLSGLTISTDVIDTLAHGNIETAVTTLSTQAASSKPGDANIALVRIQHWCSRVTGSRPADVQAQISSIAANLSAARLNRAAGVLVAEANYRAQAQAGCNKAQFDFGAIESRLRNAADAGDPASATELAQFVRDQQQRESLLQAAVDKNFAPAAYALATARLTAVQRGDSTENVASIRLLLKQAGRALPKAKLDLANCMALGCDGHPADAATAEAFGLDAARDGEPTAFPSIARMPWARRLTRGQLLSWQYFGDRLNEAGCAGDAYVAATIGFDQAITALEKSQDAKFLDQAKSEADALWSANAERAKHEQGCG
jgi:hypothetical protein